LTEWIFGLDDNPSRNDSVITVERC
jgi:hypothetical protein